MRTLKLISALLVTTALTMAVQVRSEILIGLAAPLSGPYAWAGEATEAGVGLAVADLNSSGGVLGQQVQLIVVDDYCDSEQAVAAARTLIEKGVSLVVGHQCSGAAIPASKIYEKKQILMISNGATNPRLTEDGGPGIFRVCPRDDQQAEIIGNYIAKHWRNGKIAILHDGRTYGQGLAEETRSQLNGQNIKATLYESITPGEVDYSAMIAKIGNLDIDVVFFSGYIEEAGLIVRQARDQGADFQFIVGDGVASQQFWLIADSAAEGTLMTSYPDPANNPDAIPVTERLRTKNVEIGPVSFYAYAAVQVWAQSVEKADTLDLNPVIESLRNQRFDTILGNIGFDDKGDVNGYEPFVWYVWKNGDYVLKE